MKKHIRAILIVSVFAVALSFLLALPQIHLGKTDRPADPSENHDTPLAVGAELEEELSPTASVEWLTHCTRCGHTYSYSDAGPVIGLTRGELAERYPDWSISAFSRSGAVLERTAAVYCPEHFILFAGEGRLCVYTAAAPELQLVELVSFSSAPYSFTEEEILTLASEGMAFDSLIELDRYTDKHKSEN